MQSIALVLVMTGCISATAVAQSSQIAIIELNCDEEFLLIKNDGDVAVNLKGWHVHDHDYGKAKVYRHVFQDFELKPGEVLHMQSGKTGGKGNDDTRIRRHSEGRYYIRWSDRDVWNNNCDIAYLLDAKGALVAEKHWGMDIKESRKSSCK